MFPVEPMTQKLLHDDIFAQLPEDFVRRMRNWSASLGGGSVTTSSMLWNNIGSGSFESRIPVLMGEADDTDAAVRHLPQRHQEVVTVFWRYNTHDLEWMSRSTPRLRLWKIYPATFRAWLDKGHAELQVAFIRSAEANRRRA
jgi:hypothetical protein